MQQKLDFNTNTAKIIPENKSKIQTSVDSLKIPKPDFEFKNFYDKPTPGDLLSEVYRYIEFSKQNNDTRDEKQLFEEGLNKAMTKHGSRTESLTNETPKQIRQTIKDSYNYNLRSKNKKNIN